MLLFSFYLQAQEKGILVSKKNEFRVDILSAVLSSKASISYEHFLENDFSFGLTLNYSNNQKLNEDFDYGYRNNLPKYEIIPYLRYALSKSKSRYYFAEAFASYNGGDFKEIVLLTDSNNIGYYNTQKSNYSDIALGGSLGYKMYFHDSIAVELLVGFGYNLTNRVKSPEILSRVGLNIGYRF